MHAVTPRPAASAFICNCSSSVASDGNQLSLFRMLHDRAEQCNNVSLHNILLSYDFIKSILMPSKIFNNF